MRDRVAVEPWLANNSICFQAELWKMLGSFQSESNSKSANQSLKGLKKSMNYIVPFLFTLIERPFLTWILKEVAQPSKPHFSTWFRSSIQSQLPEWVDVEALSPRFSSHQSFGPSDYSQAKSSWPLRHTPQYLLRNDRKDRWKVQDQTTVSCSHPKILVDCWGYNPDDS